MKDSKSHTEGLSHGLKCAPRHRSKKLQMWTWWRRKDTPFWAFLRARRSRVARGRPNLTTESRLNAQHAETFPPLLEKSSLQRQAEVTGHTARRDSGAAAPGSPDGKKRAVPSGGVARTRRRRNRFLDRARSDTISGKTTGPFDVSLTKAAEHIHEFLHVFLNKYGSFIPLRKQDVSDHLKKHLKANFNGSGKYCIWDMTQRIMALSQKALLSFQVVFEKHTLTLDDLSTLDQQTWLNDQVINTYGELIMDAAQHKVHFLNTFFHRKLAAKGFDGVKRWTKQVDLFSKTLVLVPVHLEFHWCLVAVDMRCKKISLLDSQELASQQVPQNILKYLKEEAREKRRRSFVDGWKLSSDEVPQQSNENDCGVFVLEYSRCLALGRPLRFSQRDIPQIRRRIYKELCERKLHG
ncbi:sentrin-specific protease 5-like [Stigmatopora nigra]